MPGAGGRGPIVVPKSYFSPTADFVADWTSTQQSMEGFGAATAFCANFSTAVADFLWTTTSGIGLSIARDKISENGWPLVLPFDGNNEVDNDFTTLAQLQARGVPNIWGNTWFFNPAWQGGNKRGVLDPSHYADACGTLTTYLDRAWAAGVQIRGISFCNEPELLANDETSWDTTQAIAFINGNLGAALAAWGAANPTWQSATGLTKPLLIMPGVSDWNSLASWTSAIESDATARGYVDRYATHQYFGGTAYAPGSISHPVWQTEVYDQSNGAFTNSLGSALVLAQNVHAAVTTGRAAAWVYWYAQLTASNDNQGLIGANDSANYTSGNQATAASNWASLPFNVTKRAYALGNWARWVRPGWVRLGTTGAGVSGVSTTAFRHPSSGAFAIILVNTNGSPTSCSVGLAGPGCSSVAPYVTSGTTLGAIGTDGNLSLGSTAGSLSTSLAMTGNALTLTLPVGVTTLVGSAP
jgi:glucuronoarabinoxylan endo-1,4-beta-xylanase